LRYFETHVVTIWMFLDVLGGRQVEKCAHKNVKMTVVVDRARSRSSCCAEIER